MYRGTVAIISITAMLILLLPSFVYAKVATATECNRVQRGGGHRRALASRRAERRERQKPRDAVAKETARFIRMYGYRVGRWYPLVHVYFPGHERDALYVMRGESGGNPHADNGICRGLWQIHECHASAFMRITGKPYFWGVYTPKANAVMTSHMTKGGVDWSSWDVRP